MAFLAAAAAAFLLVVEPVDAVLRRLRRAERETEAPTADVQLLTEIRDLLRDGRTPGPQR